MARIGLDLYLMTSGIQLMMAIGTARISISKPCAMWSYDTLLTDSNSGSQLPLLTLDYLQQKFYSYNSLGSPPPQSLSKQTPPEQAFYKHPIN